MGEKFKNWWNRPITRGDYTKWCIGSLLISAAITVPYYVYLWKEYQESKELDAELDELYS